MSDIRKISVKEFFDHADSTTLLEAYGEECAILGMPKPNPDVATYEMMENVGVFSLFASFDGDRMTGFLVLLLTLNPHYSSVIGTIESIFVSMDDRSGGAGLALISKARQLAGEADAVGLFISAPASGVFSKVMSGMGAIHTNNVFFWSLS